MKLSVAIPTCVYPRGCKEAVESVLADKSVDVDITVVMDGCHNWLPLHLMPEYQERFSHPDMCVEGHPTDRQRLIRDNGPVQNYQWLKALKNAGKVRVLENDTNMGGVWNFDRCIQEVQDADFILLLMDDEFVKPGYFSYVLKAFEHQPDDIVFAAYSNSTRGAQKTWEEVEFYDDLMCAEFFRGTYVREVIGKQGYVYAKHLFKMLSADCYLLNEIVARGYSLAMIAEPRLVGSHGHHKSLGHWQWDPVMSDRDVTFKGALNILWQNPGRVRRNFFLKMFANEPRVSEWKSEDYLPYTPPEACPVITLL